MISKELAVKALKMAVSLGFNAAVSNEDPLFLLHMENIALSKQEALTRRVYTLYSSGFQLSCGNPFCTKVHRAILYRWSDRVVIQTIGSDDPDVELIIPATELGRIIALLTDAQRGIFNTSTDNLLAEDVQYTETAANGKIGELMLAKSLTAAKYDYAADDAKYEDEFRAIASDVKEMRQIINLVKQILSGDTSALDEVFASQSDSGSFSGFVVDVPFDGVFRNEGTDKFDPSNEAVNTQGVNRAPWDQDESFAQESPFIGNKDTEYYSEGGVLRMPQSNGGIVGPDEHQDPEVTRMIDEGCPHHHDA